MTNQVTAVYNGVSFPFPEGTSPEVMKVALSAMYPELTNGRYRTVDSIIEFYVVAQNKSAVLTAVYNGVSFPFPEGTSPEVMKQALSAMYPELTNGRYRMVDSVIEFYVVAQNKSAGAIITAIYNGVSFPFPEGTSPEVMKHALSAMYPELTNGRYRTVDSVIEFYVVSQNKSATLTAVYNGVSFPFPEGTAPEVMKQALSAMYPELTNGRYRTVNSVIEFYVVAQNKSK